MHGFILCGGIYFNSFWTLKELYFSLNYFYCVFVLKHNAYVAKTSNSMTLKYLFLAPGGFEYSHMKATYQRTVMKLQTFTLPPLQ